MPPTAQTPKGVSRSTPACDVTSSGYPRHALLCDLFSAQAERSPESEALRWRGGRWTYRELRGRVRRAAARLRDRGLGEGDIVAVLLERSPQLVVTALAVLEAGGVYLPLDPHTPPRRLASVVRDARVAHFVTAPGVAVPPAPELVHVLTPELTGEETPPELPFRTPARAATDAAYVIYTSGSTGAPKGVLCNHRGLVRFVTADHPAVPGPGDRLLATANPSFDVSCYELFCTLLNGACLVLPDPDDLLDTRELARRLHHDGITTLWLSAGLFHTHAYAAPHMFSGLRCLMVGGDSISPKAVRAVLAQGPPGTLVNGYGPTENSVISTSYTVRELPEHAELVPIGTEVAATTGYVVRQDGGLAAAGEEGELWLGGDGVAIGYLNDPEQTARRFVPDRFGNDAQGRLYRTGDMVRRRPDGVLEFLGRRDRQIKLRGFRVELDEIEAVLSTHPDVRQAAVDVLGEGPGQHLGAAVVCSPHTDTAALVPHLHDHVRDRLPAHMVPSRIVCACDLPLTVSGKADHARLLARLARPRLDVREARTPRDAHEIAVGRIWCSVLGRDTARRDDDFFALGGTSLMATHVAAATCRSFGIDQAQGGALIRALLSNPTLQAFAVRSRELAERGLTRAPRTSTDFYAEARLRQPVSLTGPLPATGCPRTVLLTGATGFLGVHLLGRLLRAGVAHVYCLTRAPDAERGAARVAARMLRYGLDPHHIGDRITVIPGDLTAERFGVDRSTWTRMARDCDHIVHCAAQVNFAYPYDALAPANVGGTRTVIELAAAHRLKPLHHVSTMAVIAGFGPAGVPHVTERTPLAHPDRLALGYTETKWVAEQLVAEASHQGLPASIHRPYEITGTQDRGIWNTETMMCALFRTIAQSGVAPDMAFPLNFVPVDHTADVITRVITHERHDGRVYHLTNPHEARLSLLVDRLRAMSYRVRTVGLREWVDVVIEATSEDPRHPMAPYIPLFAEAAAGTGTALVQTHLAGAFPRFSRDNAARVTTDAGLTCPPVDDRLIDLYLGHLRESGYLPPPQTATTT
ncbi:amino acid adenylation domain-containing protein [Streptomyces sp. NPDC006704]|uniref:amino acid adenylation domain-containing protein n=1 Tax=Streptomyces sp. NPDC006704 TaxID=3364760 RepID=UPI0036A5C475